MSLSWFLTIWLPTRLAIFWRTHIKPRRDIPAPSKTERRFIIYRLDAMGDVVMTTPLFRELKRAEPKARCTVVVQDAISAILVTNPHIDEVLTLPAIHVWWLPTRMRTLLSAVLFYCRELRGRCFEVAISPRWDTDESLATFLCALSNAPCRIGYSEKTSAAKQRLNRGFDRAFTIRLPPGSVRHEVLRNLATVGTVGVKVQDRSLDIHITEPDLQFAASLWSRVPPDSTAIALGIGAGSASRRWPLEFYSQTLSRLAEGRSVQPIILCAAVEREAALWLSERLGGETIIVSGGQIREACAVLARCDIFIGNDSGCAHLAAAMACKTLVISRHPRDGGVNHSNSPLRFAPYCKEVVVLQPPTGLDSCKGGCRRAQPHCITQVSVSEVVAAAQGLLARKHSLPTTIAGGTELVRKAKLPVASTPSRQETPAGPAGVLMYNITHYYLTYLDIRSCISAQVLVSFSAITRLRPCSRRTCQHPVMDASRKQCHRALPPGCCPRL